MKIDPEICREIMLLDYESRPFQSSINFIINEIKLDIIDHIEIDDDMIFVYLTEDSKNLSWNIEYKEYCEFVNNKRQKKLERIIK